VRCLGLLTMGLLVAVLACGESPKRPASSAIRPRTSPRSVRITMDALHQLGGVPSGWQLTPLPGDAEAGRRLFREVGCASCHKVAGEPPGEPPGEPTGGEGGPGPELTGMGNHHPPAYFLEAILNPDAVLVDGPGYVSAQGHSAMPTYPNLTVTQLEDLVAYLSSLTSGDPHAGHQMPPVQILGAPGVRSAPPNPADLPSPPETAARAYFVQSYDVVPGKVQAFEEWFGREGAKRFLAVDGLVSIETYVDTLRPAPVVTTMFGFRDEAALSIFAAMKNPATVAVGTEFDAFVGAHDHRALTSAPVYRAPGLSTP
jgi:mono/diheme cytochrome c family protein